MTDLNHRVLLAHHDTDRSAELRRMLESLGVEVLAAVGRRDEIVTAARDHTPELVITSLRLEDGDAIAALVAIAEDAPLPSVVVTGRSDLAAVERALDDHVMAYLVEPVVADDLRPTIKLVLTRFEQFRELQQEVSDLKSALAARKTIEKAKGLLMRKRDLDEPAAFRLLQKTANRKRRKLVDVAEAVLLTEDLDDD